MDEFVAGTKRSKISESNEKTMYDSKEFARKDREKVKKMPIGGKIDKPKKRDVKDGMKSKNYKYKDYKEEDDELKGKMVELKRYYNQLRVKKGDLKPNKEQKIELVDNCTGIIGNEYRKFAFKHDGCRILQCMLKHGSKEQKKTIIDNLIDIFGEMMIYKYSYHLSYRMVEFCEDEEQKNKLLTIVVNKIGTLIMHMYASEVVEHMYNLGTMREKKKLIHAFYGNFFLILQENQAKSIRSLVKEKPMLKESILSKLESLSHKLIDKGLVRHTIVQAILYDYLSIADDEQQTELLNLLVENFPALLGSKAGLKVACGLFAIASSKERRTIVKAIKPLVNEMATNQVSSLFLLYVCCSLDDTVMGKKSIMNTLVKSYEDIKEDKSAMILYSCLLTGIEHPIRNVITKSKLKAMFCNYKKTTSKKEEKVRRKEMLTNLVDEICNQTDKNMVEELCGNKPFIITSLIYYCIEQNDCEEYLNSLYRCLQKEITAFKEGSKIPVISHASVHRIIKELMVDEINLKKEDPSRELHFTPAIAEILKKDIHTHLVERSVFLLATIAQNEESKHLITQQDIPKKMIKKAVKEVRNQTGLKLLQTFLYPRGE